MKNKIFNWVVFGIICVSAAGWSSTEGNVGQMPVFAVPVVEAQWIRDGKPLEFENELWYPQDGIEVLVDNEVERLGLYQEVEFFIDKTDVRPYDRLYTKFGRNKFRYFERKNIYD